MRVLATPRFQRATKKLHSADKVALDDAVRTLISHPDSGELKKGDLAGVRVYKYRCNQQQVLVAYRVEDESLSLLAFGTHENFYRDLKRQD